MKIAFVNSEVEVAVEQKTLVILDINHFKPGNNLHNSSVVVFIRLYEPYINSSWH